MWPLFGSSIPNFQTLPDIMLAIHPMPMTSPLSSHESPHKNVIVNHSNHPTIMSLHDLRGFLSHRGHQKWMVVYGCLLFFLKKTWQIIENHIQMGICPFGATPPVVPLRSTSHGRFCHDTQKEPLKRMPSTAAKATRRSAKQASLFIHCTAHLGKFIGFPTIDMWYVYIYIHVIYDDIYDIWWYDDLCV